MAVKLSYVYFLQRCETTSWWNSNSSIVLQKGELGIETDNLGKATGIKIGDGSTPWGELNYFQTSAVKLVDGLPKNAAEGQLVLNKGEEDLVDRLYIGASPSFGEGLKWLQIYPPVLM